MNQPASLSRAVAPPMLELMRCLSCSRPVLRKEECISCGRAYPCRDGIIDAIGPLHGRNKVNAEFYDGQGWVRFRPWEQAFLMVQGGARRARMEILRHLIGQARGPALALEVGIGRGDNLRFLPPAWTAHGVDVARTQLEICRRNHPSISGRLAWAEAESLPFGNGTFDACWSVGGFNYYRDHEAALREMRRVTRPGGPVVVADELPGLHRAGLGHLLGVPSLDAWWLGKLGLDRAFVEMVLSFKTDLTALFSRVWPGASRYRIWHGLGYCFVDQSRS